jgi:hypothetical protein
MLIKNVVAEKLFLPQTITCYFIFVNGHNKFLQYKKDHTGCKKIRPPYVIFLLMEIKLLYSRTVCMTKKRSF